MIDIKDIQGNVILSVPLTKECQRVEELMVSDYIQLSWNSDSNDELPIGCHIEYDSEIFRLLEPYKPIQKNEVEYTYTPQFKSKVMGWGKIPFFFYTTNEDKVTKEPDWTLTSNPADFMKCVCDALLNETGEEWTYTVDASLPASASLSFSTTDILSGLNDIASVFKTEWYADKANNILYLGKASFGDAVILEVGVNINVPSVNSSKEGYYTRFYAFGSTRNITQDYEGSNVNNLVNKRLTLDPVKYPDGYKDIREDLQEGEIFSKVLIFEDVYPSSKLSISGVRNRLMYRLDNEGKKIQIGTNDKGEPIYDQYAIWYFRIEDFDFDVSDIIEGQKLSVSFESGALSGREFELKYHESEETISTSDGLTFKANKGDYEILFIEEGNYIIPSLTGLVPSDGDSVVLFNIKMPNEYTKSAYEELEAALDKEIERLTSDLGNYSFNSNPVAFNESNPNLTIGQNVTYVNGGYSLSTRVIKLTTQLDYPIEQNITVGNEKIKGNTQQLKEDVATANKDLNLLAVFNDMTNSLQQSYARTQQMMLDGFASIKDMWVLKADSKGNQYIYTKFPTAVKHGITMYANDGSLNIPSIYDDLPIDGTTIVWKEVNGGKILSINPEIDLGGGLDENELYNYLTSNNYAKKSDIPSLDGYATESWVVNKGYATTSDLDARIDALVNGAPTAYDTLKEIADVLQGNVNSIGDIITTIGTKADKSYVDDELLKYVTLADSQEITGEKDFTGGLKVNGATITYDTTNKYWKIEGDLLVTGGVSMYSNDSEYVPSTIMDAVVVDGITITKDNGMLKVLGDLSGGVTDFWNLDNIPSWIGSSKPTYALADLVDVNNKASVQSGNGILYFDGTEWIHYFIEDFRNSLNIPSTIGALSNVGSWADGVADVDRIMYQQAGSTNWVAKSLSSIGGSGVSGDYLPLSGGIINGDLALSTADIGIYDMGVVVSGRLDAGVTTMADFSNYRTYIGSVYQNYKWHSIISVRHGNGRVDGNQYGFYLVQNDMTDLNNLDLGFRKQTHIGWSNTYYILHSGNYSSYALPLTGGILNGGKEQVILTLDTDTSATLDFGMRFTNKGVHKGWVGYHSTDGTNLYNYASGTILGVKDDGNLSYTKGTIWHSGNDGSGSGLDADLLDGKHYSDIINGNVASATKLQTARTIWGQSFNGTGNITGQLNISSGPHCGLTANAGLLCVGPMSGMHIMIDGNDIQAKADATTVSTLYINDWGGNTILNTLGGNVGIGTTNPTQKLYVEGAAQASFFYTDGGIFGWNSDTNDTSNYRWGIYQLGDLLQITQRDVHNNYLSQMMCFNLYNGYCGINLVNNGPQAPLHVGGDILATGGITMYSDLRKKTKLRDVELSLQQVANAPLIEHYYNSDDKKTTHVGSIAQYWAKMNDWFCKLDNEGFYTMEIQNAALASAISIARELVKFESETDRRIRLLEEENEKLKEEVERLKYMR